MRGKSYFTAIGFLTTSHSLFSTWLDKLMTLWWRVLNTSISDIPRSRKDSISRIKVFCQD